MDVDDEIEPLLRQLSEAVARVNANVLTPLQHFDEAVVATRLQPESQAIVALTAAFTAVSAWSALRRFEGRPPYADSDDGAAVTAGDNGAAVQLRSARVREYIAKLRELRDRRAAAKAAAATDGGSVAPDSKKARTEGGGGDALGVLLTQEQRRRVDAGKLARQVANASSANEALARARQSL